jgi:general secretion pathway protein G
MIELVFVIVVIGILAGVAIPKLAVTRDDAKIVKAKTTVSAIRNSLGMQRQKLILSGKFACNNPKLSDNADKIFDTFKYDADDSANCPTDDRVLNYSMPVCEGDKKGCWVMNNGNYRYRLPDGGVVDLKELIAESSGGFPQTKKGRPDFLAMLGNRMGEEKLPDRIILYKLDFFLDEYSQSDVIRTVYAMKVANLKNRGVFFVFLTKGVYGDVFERKMEGIADCVIELDVVKKGSAFDRYIAIKKVKNYARRIGMARYTIEPSGFVLELIEKIL